MRSLLVLILAMFCPVAVFAQNGDIAQPGQTVASVIDHYRASGWPFAYSTNLVSDDLLVLEAPGSDDVLNVVLDILAPHDLTIRTEEGLLLVVRAEHVAHPTGSLVVIVRDRLTSTPLPGVIVDGHPALTSGTLLSPGVYQASDILPGQYRLDISADAYEHLVRDVIVDEGSAEVLLVELKPAPPEIENITVSASRYEIARDIASSRFSIDRDAIENLPDVGDDPIRAAHRLPGAAASGASARAHFRGGEDSETGIILNGQRLFDPFHVRDYQNIFSSVDARAIDGIEVYTGGFPVRYGDRMSGVVLMESLAPTRKRYTEIGLSVFNTSILSSGSLADGAADWLVSARRGNLDLVIDKNFGEPRYYDLFGEFSVWLTPAMQLTANAILADDDVLIVTESDIGEREQVTSNTNNAQLWFSLENRWSDKLNSQTVLSFGNFSNDRSGFSEDPEKVISNVSDQRAVEQFGLLQDWAWHGSDNHLLRWGFSLEQKDATFDYQGTAEFFGINEIIQGAPESIDRNLAARPRGASYALYVSDRWKFGQGTVLEFGLRWDDQTYTQLRSDAQLSPRFNALHKINDETEMRFSWGRYQQSQAIQELQIEDGIVNYFPAQRADHLILGVHRRLGELHTFRAEVFHKDMSKLRPRFENLFNPLAIIPELQADRVQLLPASATASGLELSLERNGEKLSWWASYSFGKVSDFIDGRDEVRSWDQRHAFQAGLNWHTSAWNFSMATNIHSGWPTTLLSLEQQTDVFGDEEYVAVPGPRNAARVSTFATLDLRLSRSWDIGDGTLTAFVEVANAMNRKNVCCRDYDLESDDNDNEFLEYSDDYWLPLLPAAGILWKF